MTTEISTNKWQFEGAKKLFLNVIKVEEAWSGDEPSECPEEEDWPPNSIVDEIEVNV